MSLRSDVFDKISDLMTAAFGLVAALAWNDAIKLLFSSSFGTQDTIVAMFVYAVVVTVIAVMATLIIVRSMARAAKQKGKEERGEEGGRGLSERAEYLDRKGSAASAKEDAPGDIDD